MLDVHGANQAPPTQQSSGMRPSYSCNSLAAAEQLEALMRHASSGLGSETVPSKEQQALLFANALSDPDCGSSQAIPPAAALPPQQPISQQPSSSLARMPFNCGQQQDSGSFPPSFERLDFANNSLPMLLRGNGSQMSDPSVMRAVLNDAAMSGAPRLPGAMHHSQGMMQQLANGVAQQLSNGMAQQVANRVAQQLGGGMASQFGNGMGFQSHVASSPLSVLYAGATALGPNNAMGHSASPGLEEPQQKRRFVWTSDLHSRFEAACNQLGLDNAKPKSILKLMNVEGLTKANIKSHLQKYRCMVQKRAAADAMGQSTASGSEMASMGIDIQAEASDEGSCVTSTAGPGLLQPLSPPSTSAMVHSNSMDSSAPPLLDSTLITQGETSLQRNLEVQEETLLVQMDLQEQLSKQLQIQKRLQADMEGMVQAHWYDSDSSTTSKINEIRALKSKLQRELQGHLRMQHDLVTQLNQVVIPAINKSCESDREACSDLVNERAVEGFRPHDPLESSCHLEADAMAKEEPVSSDDAEDDGEEKDDESFSAGQAHLELEATGAGEDHDAEQDRELKRQRL
eukprot:CAMPEP_0119300156 /NCGR_PEP_ID=MMETSP1333-20130426/2148_1 /TAXON_ID=418940 /ORGANISM="Scyphosphaera apsteinii, Strain RCC1455" /LENGTH=570 /DNA_ID=CAMNT_0007301833 /DNA_START=52 /DNA_END=1764 /DNA_ORIENTATION=-